MTERITGLFTAFHTKDRLLRLVNDTPEIDWKLAFSAQDVAAQVDGTEVCY